MATVTNPVPERFLPASPRLMDKHGRAITDLRISITDRCNYKCVYCRTGNQGALYSELPLAEYLRMARVFTGLGIEKVRITGGEPLLRHDVVELVREFAKLRTLDGEPLDLAITTNGHLLAELAQPLQQAGALLRISLSRASVSRSAERLTPIWLSCSSSRRVASASRRARA